MLDPTTFSSEQGRGLFKYKDHSVNPTSYLQRVQYIALSHCWDMTNTRGCCIAIAAVATYYLDDWDMTKDRKMLVVQSLVKRGRRN